MSFLLKMFQLHLKYFLNICSTKCILNSYYLINLYKNNMIRNIILLTADMPL